MPTNFFRTVASIGWVIAACASAVYIFAGSWRGSAGVIVGALWMFFNFWMITRLTRSVAVPGAKVTPKTGLFLVLKFPVLYVAGFFILKAQFFPVGSLLIGLGVFVFAMTVAWIGQVKHGIA